MATFHIPNLITTVRLPRFAAPFQYFTSPEHQIFHLHRPHPYSPVFTFIVLTHIPPSSLSSSSTIFLHHFHLPQPSSSNQSTMAREEPVFYAGRRVAARRNIVVAREEEESPLTSLPTDVLSEIMVRLAAKSCRSFIRAKRCCKRLRDIGDHPDVVKYISINQIPFFVEETATNPGIRDLIDAALEAGNQKALFRVGFLHSFCAGGNHTYGYEVLKKVAEEDNDHSAIYVWCLVMTAHSSCIDHPSYGDPNHLWRSIYSDEGRVERMRNRLQHWFPLLAPRLTDGNLFHVNVFPECASHPLPNKDPQRCTRCRLDLELHWFVANFGREYIVAE